MDAIRKLCSPELFDAIRSATVEDLEFDENAVPSHSMSGDIKTGYRLRRVAGVSVPKGKFIAYVRNDGRRERHWYVGPGDSLQAPEKRIFLECGRRVGAPITRVTARGCGQSGVRERSRKGAKRRWLGGVQGPGRRQVIPVA